MTELTKYFKGKNMRRIERIVEHRFDDATVLLNPYNLETIEVPEEAVATLNSLAAARTEEEFRAANNGNAVDEELFQKGFIVPDSYEERAITKAMGDALARPTEVSTLFVVPTMGCNLNCSYCFVYQNGRDFEKQTLAWPVYERGVEAYLRSFDKTQPGLNKIVFYGGEPLMRPAFVKDVIEDIQGKIEEGRFGKRDVIFGMTTNGTQINDEVATWMAENQVHTFVSLDGDFTANSRRLTLANASASFDAAVNGIRLLEAHGLNPSISVVIGKHNIDRFESGLDWLADNFRTRTISICFVNNKPDGSERDEGLPLDASQIEAIYRTAYAKGFAEKSVESYRQTIEHRSLSAPHCGAVGGHMILRPDGKTSLCPLLIDGDETAVEVEEETIVSEQAIWLEWTQRRPLNPRMKKCNESCEYLTVCTGGCSYESPARYGSIWEVNPEECDKQQGAINVALEHIVVDRRT